MSRITEAKDIIRQNWKGAFTIPTSKLYPFQWMWDSGFVAMGTATYNVDMAMKEIQSMFSGQWANGMLPHILFHSENEDSYFPNFDFWDSQVNAGAPQYPKSSGITQPPVYGFVLEELLKEHWSNTTVRNFIKENFPRVVNYHRFLYQYRDPFEEGLVFIFHPWESGRDNSPLWDEALDSIHIKDGDIPPYQRKDTSQIDADHRPTKDNYDKYVYLLELGKKHQYDGKGIAEESPFLIQDTLMNALLIKSNDSLVRIASDLRMDARQVKEWQEQSKRAFDEKLWNDELNFYVGYDLRNQKQLLHKEIGGLTSLYAEIPTQERGATLRDYLDHLTLNGYYLCPSFDVESPLFDSKRYWRGPIWPQMNWLIYKGLKKYKFDNTAKQVRQDFLHLVDQLGFYEYFEAQRSIADQLTKGYGGGNFSWTASSYIRLLEGK